MKGTRRALRAPDDDQIDDFNTVDFTAKKLKTNRKTIYDAIARKEIPVVKVGRLSAYQAAGCANRRACPKGSEK